MTSATTQIQASHALAQLLFNAALLALLALAVFSVGFALLDLLNRKRKRP